ncbi:hypothetical protein BDN72DRAFT_895257 [Pluteus cervinus]|uniref:Uncharacterized protein n=1 Tax=Pluteus cervinus TaxID=181527 RepID=A0ACD3B2P5_9AGAR|nr:hypothetical protein BDN72DRAFT_895257 [Pluteus cervinus]
MYKMISIVQLFALFLAILSFQVQAAPLSSNQLEARDIGVGFVRAIPEVVPRKPASGALTHPGSAGGPNTAVSGIALNAVESAVSHAGNAVPTQSGKKVQGPQPTPQPSPSSIPKPNLPTTITIQKLGAVIRS